MMFKITILYDNTTLKPELEPDWGFSAFIESKYANILFDTGQSGEILLNNMKKLGKSPKSIDAIFISHNHFDHTGGLSAILTENNNLRVYIPPSFRGVKNAEEIIEVDKQMMIYNDIFTTGEISGIEQSLLLKTANGIVIIAGCTHPDLDDIMEIAGTYGPVYGIIGGLHGTKPEKLKGLELICATHCTKFKDEIKARYPDSYIEGGAGKVIEL